MAERKKGYLCTMDGSENRDHGFFTVLFEEYREPFTRFANSFVRDRAVAENLFVDALVDYWQRRDALPADTNVPAYLLASVRNKALNHLRHQRIRERSSDELRHRAHSELDFRISSLEDFTTQSLFTSEIRAIVRQTLDELPGSDAAHLRDEPFREPQERRNRRRAALVGQDRRIPYRQGAQGAARAAEGLSALFSGLYFTLSGILR